MVNVYNEIMHNAFLQGDLRKGELNFKLALLKCKLSGMHYTMQFLIDYLEYAQNHGYQALYQNAIDFILEKKDVAHIPQQNHE